MRILLSAFILIVQLASGAAALPKSLTISGALSPASGTTSLLLVSREGETRSVESMNSFSFNKVPLSFLKNATLHIASNGRYMGPVVLRSAKGFAYLAFSGKGPKKGKVLKLGTVTIGAAGGTLQKPLMTQAVAKSVRATASADGTPIGAGKLGLVSSLTTNRIRPLAASDDGADPDRDGIPNFADVDDDGDTILDAVDASTASTSAASNPFTTLYLPMNSTLNQNSGSGVSQAQIDAAIGGENLFALIFYLSSPVSSATGAHVACSPGLSYCAPAGGTAFHSGLSESSPAVKNILWSSYTTDGSPYNLEPLSRNGETRFIAGIQPRAPTSQFRAGDFYEIVYTAPSGVVATKSLVLSPYFVTVPALSTFNGGSGVQSVNYADTTSPGMSSTNPITTTAGVLSLTLWKPQRPAIPGAETGDYIDMGRLHYGVVLGNETTEFGCRGYYSGLSSTLSENTTDDSLRYWPLTDSGSDAAPSTLSTLSFSVDLANCVRANGFSAGSYRVSLTAAGEFLEGGANRAVQVINVAIP